MSDERLFSLRNHWFTTAIAVTGAIAVVSATVGFLWLPSLQANARFTGVWDAICSAAGLVRAAPNGASIVLPAYTTTTVIASPQTLEASSAISVGRGATLAMQCTVCHGARGLSDADTPNLAGQFALTIFKQLVDYKTGARTSAIMSPRVVGLTDQDIRDLSSYYAYLPQSPAFQPTAAEPAPQIVESGAPMRNIAPCATCHGGLGHKIGSPSLWGQPAVYLATQLKAFASDERRNDISQQMRNIARGMSSAEIEQAAVYYAKQP